MFLPVMKKYHQNMHKKFHDAAAILLDKQKQMPPGGYHLHILGFDNVPYP